MLQSNFNRLQGQRAGNTAAFQSGRAELGDVIERQARADSGAAAARGLTGSSFEIGQAANRARALGAGTGRLLAGSERILSADRRAAAGRLLQGHQLSNQTDLAQINQAHQNAQSQGAQLGSAFQGASAAGLFSRANAPTTPRNRLQQTGGAFSPFGLQQPGGTGGAFSPFTN